MRFFSICLLFVCLSFSTSADEIKFESNPTLGIIITKNSDFDVLYHRAESTATGAVFLGLVGAGIEEGVRGGKDTAKKKQLLEFLDEPSCKAVFVNSFTTKLTNKNYRVVELDRSKKSTVDYMLEVKIDACGFKMTNSNTRLMSAFMSIRTVLKDRDGDDLGLDKSFLIVSKTERTFESFLKNTEFIVSDFEYVQKKAGKRLANKIIYQ